jgi:hypothetical protein
MTDMQQAEEESPPPADIAQIDEAPAADADPQDLTTRACGVR